MEKEGSDSTLNAPLTPCLGKNAGILLGFGVLPEGELHSKGVPGVRQVGHSFSLSPAVPKPGAHTQRGAGGGPRQAPSCPSLASRADLAELSHLTPAGQRGLSKDLGREQDSSPHPGVPCSGAAPRTPSQTSLRVPPPPLLPALPRCLPHAPSRFPCAPRFPCPALSPSCTPPGGLQPRVSPPSSLAPASSGPGSCFPTYPQKSIPPDVPPAPCSWVCFVVVV